MCISAAFSHRKSQIVHRTSDTPPSRWPKTAIEFSSQVAKVDRWLFVRVEAVVHGYAPRGASEHTLPVSLPGREGGLALRALGELLLKTFFRRLRDSVLKKYGVVRFDERFGAKGGRPSLGPSQAGREVWQPERSRKQGANSRERRTNARTRSGRARRRGLFHLPVRQDVQPPAWAPIRDGVRVFFVFYAQQVRANAFGPPQGRRRARDRHWSAWAVRVELHGYGKRGGIRKTKDAPDGDRPRNRTNQGPQTDDIDPAETAEWLESLQYVL